MPYKKWKQQIFADSVSSLDIVGKGKMLRDGAELIKEIPEGLEVLGFS